MRFERCFVFGDGDGVALCGVSSVLNRIEQIQSACGEQGDGGGVDVDGLDAL